MQPVLTEEEEEILFWDFRESIPGEPELDYPIFDKIPKTAFTCDDKIDGYYADVEARCQVFHVCITLPSVGDRVAIKNSFLCPNGTIFNQETFACQWWPDVECALSPNFFDLNEAIGKVPESAAKKDIEQQQVVIAAAASVDAAPATVVAPVPVVLLDAPVPVVEVAPAPVEIAPAPVVILDAPVVQAEAAVATQSVAEAVVAEAAAAVALPTIKIQLEPEVVPAPVVLEPAPAPVVEVAYEPAVVAAPAALEPVQDVVIPEADLAAIKEVVEEGIKISLPQVPSGLYEAPLADASAVSSSGAQKKY